MRLFIVGATMALLLVACGGPSIAATPGPTPTATPLPPCSTTDGKKVSDQFEAVAQRWDDAFSLAGQTPRMQLSDRVADLQTIRRDLQSQTWPDCASAAKTAFVDLMQAGIDAYTAFLASEDDSAVQDKFADYTSKQGNFIIQLHKIQ